MAEALGIVGSVIAIIQISDKIRNYVKDYKDAPKEIKDFQKTMERFEQLLKRLEDHYYGDLADADHRRQAQKTREDDEDFIRGTLAQLHQKIQEIWAQLDPRKDRMVQKAWKRLNWHKVKPNVIQTNSDIGFAIQQISLSLHLDVNQKVDHLALGVQAMNERQEAQEEKLALREEELLTDQIIHWLSPLSFLDKRETLYQDCFRDAGRWLLQDEVFLCWVEGSSWLLECQGKPMVGKTVLSSILDHHLRTLDQNSFVILSIFLDYKDTARQTVPNLMASLLKQLIQQDDQFTMSQSLKAMFHEAKRRDRSSNTYLEEIVAALKAELKRYDRTYIIIDGLDEISERGELMSRLRALDPARAKLITFARRTTLAREVDGSYECDRCGRKYLRMYFKCKICCGETEGYHLCLQCKSKGRTCLSATHDLSEPYESRTIPIEIPSEDIEGYVRWQIGLDAQNNQELARDSTSAAPERPDTSDLQDILQDYPEIKDEIVAEVTKNAKGGFLMARLYVDAIKAAPTARAVTRILEGLPEKTTDDIYRDAIDRLDQKKKQTFTFQALSLITRTKRPLSMKELRHALAFIQAGLEGDPIQDQKDLNRALPSGKNILDSTTGLIIAENRETEVRLVHETFERYIKDNEKHLRWFADSVTQPAKACLDYFQFVLSEQALAKGVPQNDEYPFLMYMSQYWGDHVREAMNVANPDESVQAACIKLLNNKEHLRIVMRAAWTTNPSGLDNWDVWDKVDKLHVCAWYGLSFAVSAMSPSKSQVNVLEPRYEQTPLMYACRKGHRDVVRQLLDFGASCAFVSARGRTAIFEAVMGRHDELVEDLIKYQPLDLKINATNKKEFARSVLIIAARQGSERMVKALLNYPGIDIDQRDFNGMTALYLATKYRHRGVVEQLLEAKANLELVDNIAGRSPLRVAAERNHDEIVKSLLLRRANPNAIDQFGAANTFAAAYRGALKALDLMLKEVAGGDVETVDEVGQNLLHAASDQGHIDVIFRLINKLNPNSVDHMKMTPLHLACREGRATVVSFLLESRSVDPFLRDSFDRTPKIVAWQYGHSDVVHMLEVYENHSSVTVLVSVPSDGHLPIWSMARRGLLDLLPEAIRTRPHDLSIKEPGRQNTALQNAIECRAELVQPDIVNLILSSMPHTASSINEVNRVGRSALHTAALAGDIISTLRLIATHSVNLDAQDRWHATALLLAQTNLHYKVMLDLVKAGARIDEGKIDAQKLFFYAVEKDDIDAVEVLLDFGVDPLLQNEEGMRASQMADSDAMLQILDRAGTLVLGGESEDAGARRKTEESDEAAGEPEREGQDEENEKEDEKNHSLPIRPAHQNPVPA